jgi:hypothetical protein
MKLYIDMDSVITDFCGAVKALGPDAEQGLAENATHEQKQVMWDAMNKAGEPFWADMQWMPDGEALWEYFKPYKPTLLSSPGKFPYAQSGKIQWIDKNLPGTPVFFEDDKFYYAERDSILIDDMLKNLDPWKKMGGIGILHKDFETTKKEFEDIMSKPVMRVSLASHLRDVVALLSVSNLKEYLNKAQGVLPSSSHLKSIIVREILDKSNLKPEDIKATYKKLKEIVKGYAPSNREPFQLTILEPLQAFFNQATHFDPRPMNQTIRDFKDVMRKPEQELSESKKNVKELSKIQVGPKVLD